LQGQDPAPVAACEKLPAGIRNVDDAEAALAEHAAPVRVAPDAVRIRTTVRERCVHPLNQLHRLVAGEHAMGRLQKSSNPAHGFFQLNQLAGVVRPTARWF